MSVVTNVTRPNWQVKDEQFVWHAMKPYNPKATLIVQSSTGAWITDIEGKRYLDAMAGLWCVNVGYGREAIAKVAYDQLLESTYTPLSVGNIPALQLSEKRS